MHAGDRLNALTLERLRKAEVKALESLQGDAGLVRLVQEFTFHWELRDVIDGAFKLDEIQLKPLVVNMEEDYLDTFLGG